MPNAASRSLSRLGRRFGAQRFGAPEPTLLAIYQGQARVKRLTLDGVLLAASHGDAADDPEDVASWELVPVSGGAVPASISAVAFESNGVLRLETSDFTDGETYRIRVVGDLRFADGASARGVELDFAATGDFPEVVDVVATAKNRVRVTFSEDMENNADLVSTANYVFGGPTTLTPISVTVVSPTVVDVETLEDHVSDGLYTLTVG